MPDITDAQYAEYQAFLSLRVTPDEAGKKIRDLEAVKSEAAERRKATKDLEAEIATLKAKVPDGAKVVAGDEAKVLEALEAAGGLKKVDERLKRLDELEKKDASRTREDNLRAAGKSEGWDPDATVKALTRDAEFVGLPLEVREMEREIVSGGKTEKRRVPVGFVKMPDGKEMTLREWQEANADHLTASLKANGSNGATQPQGREFVEQRGRSAPDSKGDVYSRIREQAKKDHGGNAEGSPSPEEVLAKRLGGTPLG